VRHSFRFIGARVAKVYGWNAVSGVVVKRLECESIRQTSPISMWLRLLTKWQGKRRCLYLHVHAAANRFTQQNTRTVLRY
jgi:hypothetical protein